jgi:hypothetical protein
MRDMRDMPPRAAPAVTLTEPEWSLDRA